MDSDLNLNRHIGNKGLMSMDLEKLVQYSITVFLPRNKKNKNINRNTLAEARTRRKAKALQESRTE